MIEKNIELIEEVYIHKWIRFMCKCIHSKGKSKDGSCEALRQVDDVDLL